MPGKRQHRRRAVGVAERGGRRGVLRTDIEPGDFLRLHQALLSKPERVLAHFAELQIECLCQIEGWDQLKENEPAGVARIIFVAATMGIPETFVREETSVAKLTDFVWEPVESDTVKAIAYDVFSETLAVQFHGNAFFYTYPKASQADYEAYLAAPSKGKHQRAHYFPRKDFGKHPVEAPAPLAVHPEHHELATWEHEGGAPRD